MRFPEFSGEWEKYSLGEVGSTIIGLTYSPSDVVKDGGTIVLRSSNIQDGEIDYKDLVFVNKKIKDTLYTRPNDLLVCARNGSARLIGKNALIAETDSGHTFGAFMMIYRSEDNQFIHQLLSTKRYYTQVGENLGARINQITTSDMNSFEFYFPKSKSEKDKIAHLLGLINLRISTQKKVIEDLKKLKDAISKSLFSRYDLLEAKMQISQIGSLKNGYAFQSSSYDSSGEYEIITIANVAGERHIYTEGCNRIHTLPSDLQPHQELKDGDILISLTGNVGRVSLCKEGKYLLNQRVGLLQLKAGVNREFVYQALSSRKFELNMISCGQGAAQMNIGKGDVESYEIPYSNNPQNLQSVSLILKSYDKLVLTESTRLQLLLNQKQYIISNMFI